MPSERLEVLTLSNQYCPGQQAISYNSCTDHTVSLSNQFHLATHPEQTHDTVRQRPARKEQQVATAVPTNADESVHNTARAAGIDSRVHLMPMLAQHGAHGGAGVAYRFESRTSLTLPLVLHPPK